MRKVTLQAFEQNLTWRSSVCRLMNTLPQTSQVWVAHLSHIFVCGLGLSISAPHFWQSLGGQVGYGKRHISNRCGWLVQYALSALEWQLLQRVIKLWGRFALLVSLKRRKGILWWAVNVCRLPTLPQDWQVKLSLSRIDRDIVSHPLPLYIAIV